MADYKTAKEAFVADNPGASIWSINAISFAALSSYALYAISCRRNRPSPLIDYLSTIFPLLLSVTISSTHPYALNILLLAITYLIYLSIPPFPSLSENQDENGPGELATGSGNTSTKKRSKGKWLDESDSDEEPAEPVAGLGVSANDNTQAGSTATSSAISRPSLSFAESRSSTSTLPSPIEPPSNPSPFYEGLTPEKDQEKQRTWKRRHSPTPSTHTHTAINILPTPESNTFALQNDSSNYPTNRKSGSGTSANSNTITMTTTGPAPKLPFLSVYRSHMMIMTVHCILAVDFPVFPRWLGKCEDFGTSLMDVGVGSFVFSLGIVSTRQFLVSSSAASKVGGALGLLTALMKAFRKSAPVLVLGIVRVLMVKGSDYPEHVTEYGVHWNFFFTLGLLPVFGVLLAPAQRRLGWTGLAILVTLAHQYALNRLGLQGWVLSTDRTGLLGMNKEGLVSLPGYLAIYLLGLSTGQHILRGSTAIETRRHNPGNVSENPEEHEKTRSERRRTELAMELFGYSIGWWLVLLAIGLSGGELSRRMANLAYVLWTAAYNTSFLLGYLVIELFLFPTPTPRYAVPGLLEAINKNGLVVFLAANLLTGLVNVSIQTMYTGNTMAMVVLLGYSGLVCTIAWLARGVRIKL